jgi:hypothetical protein
MVSINEMKGMVIDYEEKDCFTTNIRASFFNAAPNADIDGSR